MIIVTQFTSYSKDKILYIRGMEAIPCPVCGGRLFVHGTCERKSRDETGQVHLLQLRVMECESCGRTHREIPDILVPYKRYSTEAICTITEKPEVCTAEPVTCKKISLWLSCFLYYAQQIAEGLILQGLTVTEPSSNRLLSRLKHFVRLVTNSGFWQQHRSVMT